MAPIAPPPPLAPTLSVSWGLKKNIVWRNNSNLAPFLVPPLNVTSHRVNDEGLSPYFVRQTSCPISFWCGSVDPHTENSLVLIRPGPRQVMIGPASASFGFSVVLQHLAADLCVVVLKHLNCENIGWKCLGRGIRYLATNIVCC